MSISNTHSLLVEATFGGIVVPDDYATIQAAIEAAHPGDTIYIKPGTYPEQLIVNKTVRLVGEDQKTTTILGLGWYGEGESVITVEADGVEVMNFTMKIDQYGMNSSIIGVCSANNCSIISNRLVFGWCGIKLEHANNSVICNNLLDSNWEGITLINSSCNAIQENMFFNNGNAIRVISSSNNTIHDNDIADSIRDSVIIQNSSNGNVFFKNNISRVASMSPISTDGIAVVFSSYNRIYENLIKNIRYACNVIVASYNMIYKNTIKGNVIGIYLIFSSYNEICSNNVIGNEVGIKMNIISMHNIIRHNNFNNAKETICLDYPNYWDNEYPSGGNYWSDYNGADEYSGPFQNETGSDGIGDASYTITEANVDHYPLMSPANLFEAITPEPMPAEIELVSNSTISNFEVNMTDGRIRFEVSGETGTGYCRITIPNSIVYGIWGGSYTVLVDGVAPLRAENWTDHTNTYIYFTYHHSKHEVIIVPEYSLIAILPLLISTMVLAFSFKRRQSTRGHFPQHAKSFQYRQF